MGCLQFYHILLEELCYRKLILHNMFSVLLKLYGVLPFFRLFCFSWARCSILRTFNVCVYTNVFSRLSVESFNTSSWVYCLCRYLFRATTFRWYLYSPNNLIHWSDAFRNCIFCSRRILSFKQAGKDYKTD